MSGRIWSLQIPDQPVRGAFVSLGQDWAQLVEARGYSAAAAQLLGQTLLALPMMGMHLKTPSRMSFQISQAPPLQLLTAQAASNGDVRGMIKLSADTLDAAALSGQLVVTLEPQNSKENFQGIVALEGDGPAQWLQRYFEQSEQVATRLVLCADQNQACGLMLQAVPGQDSSLDWQALVDALDVDVLPSEPGEWLSALLGMDLRVSETPQAVQLRCSCNADNVAQMLHQLGPSEAHSIIQERGQIDIECGFCGENYAFDADAVNAIFAEPERGSAVH